jgi:hypothetical protein
MAKRKYVGELLLMDICTVNALQGGNVSLL